MNIASFIKRIYAESWRRIVSRRRELFLPFLIDIAFLFLSGFIQAAFAGKVTQYAVHLGFLVSSRSGALTQQYVSSSVPQLMYANPEIASAAYTLIALFSLSSFAAFLLFIILQSLSFRIIMKAAGYPVPYGRFFIEFCMLSLFWLAFMVVYWISSYADALRFTLSNRALVYQPSLFLIIYLLILGYFALISYSLIGTGRIRAILKKTASLGIKKGHILASLFFSLFILYSILNVILVIAFTQSPSLALGLGFALVLPALLFGRIAVIRAVRAVV